MHRQTLLLSQEQASLPWQPLRLHIRLQKRQPPAPTGGPSTPAGAGAAVPSALTVGRVFTAVIKDTESDGTTNNQLVINLEQPPTDGVVNLTNLEAADDAGTVAEVRIYKVDNKVLSEARTSRMVDKINVYSFALKPEEHQPSGTCNFSRIDNAQLQNDNGLTGTIYAVNYNVLRIMSGMGGLAYSN